MTEAPARVPAVASARSLGAEQSSSAHVPDLSTDGDARPHVAFSGALACQPCSCNALAGDGAAGTLGVVAALGSRGYLVTGSIGGLTFSGLLDTPTAGSAIAAEPADRTCAVSQAAKRRRTRIDRLSHTVGAEPGCWDGSADGTDAGIVGLPETIHSLLARLQIRETGLAHPPTPAAWQDHAATQWGALDAHTRSLVEAAVRADEERYRIERAARDARLAACAARQRRDEALQAAIATVQNVRSLAESLARFSDISAAGAGPICMSGFSSAPQSRAVVPRMSARGRRSCTLLTAGGITKSRRGKSRTDTPLVCSH